MTVALLLNNVFERLGDGPGGERLSCKECDEDHQLRAARGCMARPVLPDGSVWDAEAFYAERSAEGWSRESIGTHAEYEYPHANVGQVAERRGFLWPCCPKSFALFASHASLIAAESALRMARARRAGDPTAARSQPLTPGGLELLELASMYWDALEDDRRRSQRTSTAEGDDTPTPTMTPVERGPRR